MNRNEQWAVGEHVSIDLRVPVGLIEIYVGDVGTVHLSVDAADADEFEIHKTGDRISVRHPSRWRMRGRNSRVTVHVPAGSDVEVDSASGEVRMAGRLGAVRVRTASGDVEIGDVGKLDATTASGSVSCREVSGDADVTTVSGDCTLQRVGGRLEATLTSGDLRVDACGGDISVGSTSGDVRLGRCDGSDIAVRSISGDVRLGLPTGVRVDADVSTLSGRATLPDPAPPTGQVDRRPVRLQLKSVSGDIRIERAN